MNREKEMLRKMLHQVADFSGVRVLTFCMMNNHFHVLVEVPPVDSLSDAELIRRYRVLYPKPTLYATASIKVLEATLRADGVDAQKLRAQLMTRMGDVSEFMKTLKQRFSIWFNKTHNRFGPLWSDRFKSVLVEGKPHALQTMAAYIDLNPVRAGIVNDPKDYRFCNYAEAVAGREAALQAVQFLVAGHYSVCATDALADYRCSLFGRGAAERTTASISRRDAVRVLKKQQGRLPLPDLLRCRIRFFTEGALLGSSEFVQAHAQTWKKACGKVFRPKPKLLHQDGNEAICAMKNVRGQAFF